MKDPKARIPPMRHPSFVIRQSSRVARPLLFAFAALLLLGNAACTQSDGVQPFAPHAGARSRPSPIPMPQPVRAVWVARFHYKYADDIRVIMRNCAEMGFNTVLWQVRGNATVAYPSRLEPWAEEFDFRDPGFDPLGLAVQEAHANGLRIEAWVNVMPGWRGRNPPAARTQLWHTHPHWFLHDAAGARQPLGDFYVILNPCLPQVRRHITSVMEEIVTRYEVDGLHMDYVRYAWDTTPNARNLYPRDPETLRLYRQQTGLAPDDDPQAWDSWRANQLTQLVSDIRRMTRSRRPGLTLTAATWGDPTRGYRDFFQNAVGWLRSGLLDAAYPMAYTPKLATLDNYIGAYQSLAPGARIIPGLGVYMHKTPDQTARQAERCRLWGGDVAVFSYESIFAAAGDRNAKPADLARRNAERQSRRNALAPAMGRK